MDFLTANWFSLLMLAILVMDRAITRGKRDEKMQQVIDKVEEIETVLDEAVKRFNEHCTNPDIHINQILMRLFDERFSGVRKELADTRTDIQRIEHMLQQRP